jgi:hypothetical protein
LTANFTWVLLGSLTAAAASDASVSGSNQQGRFLRGPPLWL